MDQIAEAAFRPLRLEFYPERQDREEGWLYRVESAVSGWLGGASQALRPAAVGVTLRRIARAGRGLERLHDAALEGQIRETRVALRRHGLTAANIRRGFALVREVSRRELGLRHHDVQILGGLAMIRGELAEMDTGEGKTITAALAAATAAMAGIPVHIVTVNGYLARRDCETLMPVYRALGLTVAVVEEGMEPAERRAAYDADICYASNTEIAFDYLRDRLVFGGRHNDLRRRLRRLTGDRDLEARLVMRGLHFAIVDEADSVLVDEARTPLIISRQSNPEDEAVWASQALDLARNLRADVDYKILGEERRVRLTDQGRETLARCTARLDGLWASPIRREEVIHQALSALYIFKLGDHYLIHDGKVQIVDEYTGRLQPDRSWSDGLHQLIEAKEGVEVTGQNLSMARITYQRFFRRYRMLAGMTGTAREVRGELWSVYGLRVARIPPNRPSRLRFWRSKVRSHAEDKWAQVARSAARELAKGRPVLIGTRSVAASLTASEALTAAGIEHQVLNAENDTEEATVIAQAGERGRVTVATNMAGRGVDIALAPGVAEAGGLHVILTERHDAGRIDRQLAGRAGRRGEPGSVEAILSLDDPLIDLLRSPLRRRLARFPWGTYGLRLRLFDRAQRRTERAHARARKDLVYQDRRLNTLLSFTGGLE
ncbi:prepilin peptidase [Tropicimonas sp. IMCC6043]|uniref:preprotein translocase subunit SecA n=1 Tax=Tropicimonas sp. IMCC6043 TaxID=2510645 RepID=UPI00101C390C|nr:prepilin peptidase [Tropicimonas sp. IMCC6043]RYH07327.1 prepilin peptidase [Tropicimonas sp. IMCC6043]